MKEAYEIVITAEGEEDRTTPIAGNNDKTETPDKIKKSDVAWYVAYKKVTPYIKSFAQHEVSKVSVQTGRQEAQLKTQFVFDRISEGVDFVFNVAVGLKTGGALGAVAGAGISLLGAGINVFQRMDTLRTEQNLENISLGLMTARTGGIKTFSGNSR